MGGGSACLQPGVPLAGRDAGASLSPAETPAAAAPLRLKTVKDPLLPPLIAVIAGVSATRFLTLDPGPLAWALAALSSLAVLACWKAGRAVASTAALAALAAAGALVAELRRPPPPPRLDAAPGEIVILEGCVVEPPVFFEDREQFVLELAPGARARVTLPLAPGEPPPRLRYGQRVEFEARVRPPRNFGNPGAFDYAGYLARKDIYWLASLPRGARVRTLSGACGNGFTAAVLGLRAAGLDRIERLHHPDSYGAAMMQAVLLGESSRVEKVWTEDFRRTGTYHALVISGLHVGVLAGSLLLVLRVCMVPAGTAAAIAALAAWLYALVSGWQPPAVRAAAGFTLFLVARSFHRRGRVLNLLAAVALAFLALDPAQLFEASFQLSFLAVAAIGALAVPFLEAVTAPLARGLAGLGEESRDLRLEPRTAQFRVELRLLAETAALCTGLRRAHLLAALGGALRLWFWMVELVTVSAAVQLGLVLPMIAYFHRVSFSGLFANLAIVPLINTVIPLGFISVLTGWSWTASVNRALLEAARRIAAWCARYAEPGWRVPDPPQWLSFAFTASLVLLCLAAAGTWKHAGRRVWIAMASACAVLLAVLLAHPFPPRVRAGALELTAIDVGQGESLLAALPEGRLVLVDGGGIPSRAGRRPRLDIGEDVVSPYLWSRSIRRLDVVVSTHAHEDHTGGLAAILENFRPAELWTSSAAGGPAWDALEARARQSGVRIARFAAGQAFTFGGARFDVLAPPPGRPSSPEPRNDDSLALRVSYGAHSFLLTGDIEAPVERWLAAQGTLRPATVLKLAHHGSRTSSCEEFLEAARPAFAIVSAGYGNPFHNPHPEVLARLAARRTAVLRTDLYGAVTLRTGGRRIEVETARYAPAPPPRWQPF